MPSSFIKTELHVHTNASFDSRTSIREIAGFLEIGKIDKVGITDHATIATAVELYKRFPNQIIIGEEIKTTHGEIIGLFLQASIPSHLSPLEVVEEIRKQGGIVYLPHPFDKRRSGIYQCIEYERILQEADVIEVFNARVICQKYNREAEKMADYFGKRKAVGSDAHTISAWGTTYQIMPDFSDARGFLTSLDMAELMMKKSSFKHVFNPTLNKWLKRSSSL